MFVKFLTLWLLSKVKKKNNSTLMKMCQWSLSFFLLVNKLLFLGLIMMTVKLQIGVSDISIFSKLFCANPQSSYLFSIFNLYFQIFFVSIFGSTAHKVSSERSSQDNGFSIMAQHVMQTAMKLPVYMKFF